MLAITWSLVSCSDPSCSPTGLCSFPEVEPSVERIDATTGRQTAQPRPVPKAVTISVKVSWPPSLTSWYSSARDIAKCSHMAVETVMPERSSSLFKSLVRVGTQERSEEHTVTWPMLLQPWPVTELRKLPAPPLLP